MKRLVVISQKKFVRTRHGVETTGAFLEQMQALQPYFRAVTLCVPFRDDAGFRGVACDSERFGFHPLPYYRNRREFLRAAPRIGREVLRAAAAADLCLIVLPGYVGFLASWLLRARGRPRFQWVVGDWPRVVASRRRHFPARLWADHLLTPLLTAMVRGSVRRTLTFFNGGVPHRAEPVLHRQRISSSIRAAEVPTAVAAPAVSVPLRLLFVGRLAAEKGIPQLLRALRQLRREGRAVELDLVGGGEEEAALRRLVEQLGLTSAVRFHGYLPRGERLQAAYRAAHLLVHPALEDMQPRVLMEAMAHGLPLVATTVGNVPALVQHRANGLLVPPGQPTALAAAVCELAEDAALRQRLVEGGLAFVRRHTVEAETRRMLRTLALHFDLR